MLKAICCEHLDCAVLRRSRLVGSKFVGNIITRHANSEVTPRGAPNDATEFVNMSNGLTSVVISILAIAMAEGAETPRQQ